MGEAHTVAEFGRDWIAQWGGKVKTINAEMTSSPTDARAARAPTAPSSGAEGNACGPRATVL